jgi:hypothetical protein
MVIIIMIWVITMVIIIMVIRLVIILKNKGHNNVGSKTLW